MELSGSKSVRLRILDRLRKLLHSHGMTHDELAEALAHVEGCSRSNIAAWFTGARPIQAYHAVYLAQLFGVTTDYLLGLDDERVPDADKIDSRIQELQNEIQQKGATLDWTAWEKIRGELGILTWRKALIRREQPNKIPLLSNNINEETGKMTTLPEGITADYALTIVDEYLTGLGIHIGDIVYVKKNSDAFEGDLVVVVSNKRRVVRKYTTGTQYIGRVVGVTLRTTRPQVSLPFPLEDKLSAARQMGIPDDAIAASIDAVITMWRGQLPSG